MARHGSATRLGNGVIYTPQHRAGPQCPRVLDHRAGHPEDSALPRQQGDEHLVHLGRRIEPVGEEREIPQQCAGGHLDTVCGRVVVTPGDPYVVAGGRQSQPGVLLVELDRPAAAGPLTSVWSDDSAAVRDTLTYLTALGHRSVARVAGLPDLIHTQLRDRAQREICAELGLGEPVIVHTDYSGDDGAHATRRLISSVARPTAVIYDNDIMAVAGLSVAQEMGLDVPGDLSLVAWDDSQLSRVVRPPLTALSRDIPAYGSHAARTLMALVTEGSAAGFEDSAARLVPRGSTAPPR